MIENIDFDVLNRVVNCIYGRFDDFGANFTVIDGRLNTITVRNDFENGNGLQRFSIDLSLRIESHDGTDRQEIIDCFRSFGINAI